MNDVIQWIAVCGGGGGSRHPRSPYHQMTTAEIVEQVRGEYREISRMATAALAYAHKYETYALERLVSLVPAQGVTPRGSHESMPEQHRWLPYGGPTYHMTVRPLSRPTRWLAVLVTDTSGRKHFVPYQRFGAFDFAKAMYDLASLPTVAKIDTVSLTIHPGGFGPERLGGTRLAELKSRWGNLARERWGHIIAARHTNTDSIIRALQVQPQAPPIPPSPVAPPIAPVIAPPPQAPPIPLIPVAIPTTPAIAAAGARKINWFVVAGIGAAALIGVVLLRRMR